MSNRLKSYNPHKTDSRVFDKFEEHVDHSPLGKIQRQYWTTKQQVIKKFGKKEDEFVVLSDAELDAKLDLFEAIEESSTDLLRMIEMYQEHLIGLSIEESEMSTFLKSESTYDTKTKAGKIMAAVSKAQHFAVQQRNALRLPLVRLYNEVETFRLRAISDTFLTVRTMENARTEYRGALLWMKNVSTELDPDATRKLEKFRRVQAQVKKTKTKFDRLKLDVTQKVDMLSTSRCNMFSHVLVNYQRALILFWTKTAKTFSHVAEAFKGCEHYEFNIIKDLVEPSRKMARQKVDNSNRKDLIEDDSSLDQSILREHKETLINFDETSESLDPNTDATESNEHKRVDEVNQLIDLMTLNEANDLNEQLKELEILEQEKKSRNNLKDKTNSKSASNELGSKLTEFGAFVSNSIAATKEPNSSTDLVDLDLGIESKDQGFKDMLSNASDEFEREWQSAFSKERVNDPTTDSANNFAFFSQISENNSNTGEAAPEASDLMGSENLGDFLFSAKLDGDKENVGNKLEKSDGQSRPGSEKKNLSAWYDLFAELDPLKNPDAIGQQEGIEEARNC